MKELTEKEIDRVRKIYALVLHGSEGERDVAQNKLDMLMVKYDIEDINEIMSEKTHECKFKYGNGFQKMLLFQLYCRFKKDHKPGGTIPYKKQRNKMIYYFDYTVSEYVDVSEAYEYYKGLWKEEIKIFELAFIHKHELFSQNERDSDAPEATEADLLEYERIMAMKGGLQDGQLNKKIEYNE